MEQMEARLLLAADALRVGVVYIEEDLGSDIHGDTFEVSFVGGADQTQFTKLVIDGDQRDAGLSLADVIFDTAAGGLGADHHIPLSIVSHEGIDQVTWQLTDGSSRLEFEFVGFDAGDKLVFSVDVDEVQNYEAGYTQDEINDGLDPITSGIEFQGSLLVAEFQAPHFHEVTADAEFRNRYDADLAGTGLDLPADDSSGRRDRTAGAVGQAVQEPLPVSLAGVVYAETDLDLIQDAGEEGIAGVTLELWRKDGDHYVATGHRTQTDAAGRYEFGTELDLKPGTYQIRELQPDGYFSVGAIPGTVDRMPVGETVAGDPDVLTEIAIPLGGLHGVRYDFAEAVPAQISGYVYHDRDNDGARDLGEEGIRSGRVEIIPVNVVGQQTTVSVTTDANGFYDARGLAPGTYRVVESLQPAGYLDGLDAAGTVAGIASGSAVNPGDEINAIFLGGGQAGVEYNFGELLPATIEGRVQLSTPEGDCFGETTQHGPVAGVIIELWNHDGKVIATTTTDENGTYSFTNLRPGTYGIHQRQPQGLIDGSENPGTVAGGPAGTVSGDDLITGIELASGQTAVDVSFCEHEPASLSGFVYHDRDDDGAREAGEEGLARVRIVLSNESGQVVAETTTDDAGHYRFADLPAGTYSITEQHPDGWLDGLDTAGLIDGVPVGVAQNPGDRIDQVLLKWGDDGEEYNFGEYQGAAISGRVQLSTPEGDCFGETTEHGPVAGVIIELWNHDGNVIATTTTDENGTYSFTNLRPGTYGIHQRQPQGLIDGSENPGTLAGGPAGTVSGDDLITGIRLASGQTAVDVSFCEHEPASLSGFVYHDRDDDGAR